MKLLIITQKVDKDDPVLGFFHSWIDKLSAKFEQISVVCLQKGEYDLPKNVKVFSLGKGKKVASSQYLVSRAKYIFNFYKYIWSLRKDYDAVFVHMNQEYVILGWKFWKLWGKKIYLWRNHPKGNLLTRIAVAVSNKVFCTSTQSFTAKYKKTEIMPVGVDAELFRVSKQEIRDTTGSKVKEEFVSHNSSIVPRILFLSRMDKIKRPDLLIEALNILDKKQVDFVCDFYGDPTVGSEAFYQELKNKVLELGLQNKVKFYAGVPNTQTPELYNSHEIFVNLTPTGSMDKTIVEASSSGCLLLTANLALQAELDPLFILKEADGQSLARALQNLMNLDESEKASKRQKLVEYAKRQSLEILIEKLSHTIQNA